MKLKIATLVGVLALVASSAFAGGMQWVAVKGGAALPSGDLSDVAGTGFNVGGEYGYSMGKWALGADVAYDGFGKKDPSPYKLKVYQYTAQGWWMFPMKDPKQYPYIGVGVGAYTLTSDAPGAESKTKLGINGNVGYNYGMSNNMAIGVDAGYHWIQTGDDFKKADGSNATASLITLGVHLGWGFGAGMKK